MNAYNTSLDDLPESALVVDRKSELRFIRDPKLNLVIWPRLEINSITDFLTEADDIYAYDGNHHTFLEDLSNLSPDRPGKRVFMDEYRYLYEIMEELQPNNASYLNSIRDKVPGFQFHQDEGYSLNWTLVGPTCLWVEEQHVTRRGSLLKPSNWEYHIPRDISKIRQFPDNVVAIYKGISEEDRKRYPKFSPFVHSRPERKQPTLRALHQIYLP